MIQVNGLTKRFGDFPAISGLDCVRAIEEF